MLIIRAAHFLAIIGYTYGKRTSGLTASPQVFASQSYDYLIVGGGTAGLTVASRLTENAGVTVGVIEAGLFLPNDTIINTPFFFGQNLGNTTVDWSFSTTPQPNLGNRSIFAPRGKVVGGSSALNFMVFGRASKPEYDAWAALGNPGWDWNGLLPYFKKSETVTPGDGGVISGLQKTPGTNSSFEGKSGPLKISYNTAANFVQDLAAPYTSSFGILGSSPNPDPESGDATGVFQSPRSVDPVQGIRSYATTAYLMPALGRNNLLLLTGAQVTQVLFEKKSGTLCATGVQYDVNGKRFVANASKEIILSAGSIKTPQLLELSGIGNPNVLSQFGIPVKVGLPGVGENLQDHLLAQSDFLLKDPAPATWDLLRNNATFEAEQQQLYAKSKTGIFAATSAIFGFNPIQTFLSPIQVASLLSQLTSTIKNMTLTPLQAAQYTLQQGLVEQGQVGQIEFGMVPSGGTIAGSPPPLPGRSYIAVASLISRPFSRGSIHIGSSDPLAAPIINPRYLSFAFDAQLLSLGLQVIRKLSQTGALGSIVESPSTPPANVSTAADFDNYILSAAGSVFHPSGTAALAPQALGGVVDHNLLVYGTGNLRVVDASIVPLIVAAHLQSTVYAIAEKAADIIKSQA